MNVAMLRVKQVATQAINKSISEQVASKSDFDKLVDWKMNKDGKISGFMLNYAEHMRITSETINTVQTTLDEIGDIPEHVPIGQARHDTLTVQDFIDVIGVAVRVSEDVFFAELWSGVTDRRGVEDIERSPLRRCNENGFPVTNSDWRSLHE